jgi:hypothetical protein
MEFRADQVIGKTLIGIEPVKIVRIPNDAAPAVFTTATGQPIGTVQTYLAPSANRSNLYWGFIDSNGRPYYAEHRPGRFDFEALKGQGLKTLEERKQEQEEKAKPLSQKIMDTVTKFVFIGAAAYLLGKLIGGKSYAAKS